MRHHIQSGGRTIELDRYERGSDFTVLYLNGHTATIDGERKIPPIKQYCETEKLSFVCFDYSGWGRSGDLHQRWDVARWAKETIDIIDHIGGKIIIIGHSMGGYIMALAAAARPDNVIGLYGISAGFGEYMEETGQSDVVLDNENLVMKLNMEDGDHIITNALPVICPVFLIHGYLDKFVSPKAALNLLSVLETDDVTIQLLKEGVHAMDNAMQIDAILQTFGTFTDRISAYAK